MGKAKKVLARTLAMALSMTTLFSAAACGGGATTGGAGGGGLDPTKTTLEIGNFGGGVGRKWLDEAFARFAALDWVAEREWTPGKKGLQINVVSTTGVKVKNMKEQAFHMFFAQGKYNDYFAEIQKGDVMDISDIMDDDLGTYGEPGVTIADKIPAEYLDSLKGNDGNYYMLPHYGTQSAATYDVDLFEDMGFYLAQPDMGMEHTTELIPGQTYYFTGDAACKTVGNDGIAGTDDDGLPTTLNELVAMCDYISNNRVEVFSFPGIGAHIDYSNHLILGLWAGLSGYDQRRAVVTHAGTVDYVTGMSETEIWPGTGIYAPVTETVTLAGDSTDGYKAIDQASRYYAFAFMELAWKQGWLYERFTETNYTHKEAMRSFILNGHIGIPKIAAHVEGSYWYNEAEGYGLFNDYKVLSGTGSSVKNLAHWHMPTSIGNDVVTGTENARDEVVMNGMTSNMLINGNLDTVSGNEGIIEACKEFFKFLSTEQELKNFTACTGVAKALYQYTIDDSVLNELDPYQQTVMRVRAGANCKGPNVVNQYGTSQTYRNKASYFTYSANCTGFSPYFDGKTYYAVIEVYELTNKAGKFKNAWECFKATGYSETKWMTEIYVEDAI